MEVGAASGVGRPDHRGTPWGGIGDTPGVPATGQRVRLPRLSAIRPPGRLRVMLSPDTVAEDRLGEVLRRLRVGAPRPLFLRVDPDTPHRDQRVQAVVAAQDGRLPLLD